MRFRCVPFALCGEGELRGDVVGDWDGVEGWRRVLDRVGDGDGYQVCVAFAVRAMLELIRR